MSKLHSRFNVIHVDQDDIKGGKPTVSGNPICRALRRHGYRGARIDGEGFLHTYDGSEWTLRICPTAPWRWLWMFLSGKKVRSFRFGLPKETPKP